MTGLGAPSLPRFGRVAIVQTRPGIGDMVWHLPHIRALAAHADRGAVLVTKSRALPGQLVGPADGIDAMLTVERGQWRSGDRHEGARGLLRLVADLRALECDAAVLLTRSRTLAWCTLAAGIPRRHGLGLAGTRATLRPPFLDRDWRAAHPHAQVTEWIGRAGIAMPSAEPTLLVDDAARLAALHRLGGVGEPLVAVGIAGSDAWKQWSGERFAALIGLLADAGRTEFALVGGPAEQPLAEAIRSLLAGRDVAVQPVLGWDLRELAALLAGARCYVGNDTAALNIAAAVGVRSYGLFGATPVLRHSRHIVPVVPPGGPDEATGMARITPEAVLQTMRDDQRD